MYFLNDKRLRLVFWVVWPIVVFFGVQFGLSSLIQLFISSGLLAYEVASSPLFSTIFSVVSYAAMIAILVIVPNKFFRDKIDFETIGLKGWPKWSDIGLGIIGFVASLILAGILSSILSSIWPGFNPNQAQETGFSQNSLFHSYQFILAFMTLVIAAPLAEEVMFRGIIYGELKEVNPWIAMMIVSTMFGAAHGQWNVGITTFAMSLIMCLMREKMTGTIWAPIILHMVKNAVAFFLLFIAPNIYIGPY